MITNKEYAQENINRVLNRGEDVERNDFMRGQEEIANFAKDVITDMFIEGISKDERIKKLEVVIKMYLIAVKNGAITVFPNDDGKMDYLQILEDSIK